MKSLSDLVDDAAKKRYDEPAAIYRFQPPWPLTVKNHNFTTCDQCGVENYGMYMVHPALWASAYLDHDHNVCPVCLERRIGRELMPVDFTDVPCNAIIREFGTATHMLFYKLSKFRADKAEAWYDAHPQAKQNVENARLKYAAAQLNPVS